MNQPQNLDKSISYLIHEVARLFRRRFEDVARRHDLTLPQWRVLAELNRNDGQLQVMLASAIDADPMTLSGILDRLEKRGLVAREQAPSDSRAKIVRLTAEGQELFGAARLLGGEILDLAVTGMSPAELEALRTGLGRLRDNLSTASADGRE